MTTAHPHGAQECQPSKPRRKSTQNKRRTAIDIDIAAQMWNEGQSGGQIGEFFGLSRCAVLGFVRRNRDRFNVKGTGFVGGRVGKPGPKPKPKPVRTEPSGPKEPKEPRSWLGADELAYDAARMPHAATLLALDSDQCHWPLNDGGPYLFCAAEAQAHGNYCNHHRLRATADKTSSKGEDA